MLAASTLAGVADDSLPASLRTVHAASASELRAAVENALAGDRITVADELQFGGLELPRRPGTSKARPIVLCAEHSLRAKIDGRLTVTDDDWSVCGFDFIGKGTLLVEGGARFRITRNRFIPAGRGIHVIGEARDGRIDHNEIVGVDGKTRQGIDVTPVPGIHCHVDHNYLHGLPKQLENGSEGIRVGNNPSHSRIDAQCVIEYNLLDGWSGDAEAFSNKSSGNTWQFNTLINSNAEFVNRHGQNNRWYANWIEKPGGLRIQDQGQEVVGNRVLNGAVIRLQAGDVIPADYGKEHTKASGHPAATNTVLAGNEGVLIIGDANLERGRLLPATDTVIESHTGEINRDVETGTSERPPAVPQSSASPSLQVDRRECGAGRTMIASGETQIRCKLRRT